MPVVAPQEFEYECPVTLDEALAALAAPGAMALAGGTDLVPLRADGKLAPEVLVDIKRIEALAGVTTEGGRVRIGSATRMADLTRSGAVDGTAVGDGAALIGAVQTRERATIGGNVCRSSPAGDTLPGLLVVSASVKARSGERTRTISLDEFFVGPGLNRLDPGELLIEIELDARRGHSAYQRLTYRAWMDLAVIGVAVWLELEGARCSAARVALGGLGPRPLLAEEAAVALVGSSLEPAVIASAVDAAVAITSPITDVRGTRQHRIAGLRALLPRVVQTARARAEEAG
jgi:CO/xanthine dehydrogenase FAD-binding subunit